MTSFLEFICNLCCRHSTKYLTQSDIDDLIVKNRIIIIDNFKVYDVTQYVDDKSHPGNNKCIIDRNGQDCTSDFDNHTFMARKILKQYYLGQLQKE